MDPQTKVEDAKVEVPETDASIFGPSMATPAPPRNLSSQSGYESKILFINFSWVIPGFLKVELEDAKVKVLETDA